MRNRPKASQSERHTGKLKRSATVNVSPCPAEAARAVFSASGCEAHSRLAAMQETSPGSSCERAHGEHAHSGSKINERSLPLAGDVCAQVTSDFSAKSSARLPPSRAPPRAA
jgi:hypothetical protein